MVKGYLAVKAIGLVVLLSVYVQGASYGGGSGTAVDPYQIWTPQQMNTIGANPGDWGKHFKLMADINMSIYTGTQYKIIGNSATKFTGTFDGNGHIINHLIYTTTVAIDYVGLFGCTQNATIKNLGVENVSINLSISVETSNLGGLIGLMSGGSLTDCHVTGTVNRVWDGLSSIVGGLVGQNQSGSVTNCYVIGSASTDISPGWDFIGGNCSCIVGGLAGVNSGMLTNCFATGSVYGESDADQVAYSYVGGMVGKNEGSLTLCYATSSVSGSGEAGPEYPSICHIGGLVGENDANITSSYATGLINGTARGDGPYLYVGGLAGSNSDSGIITASYATGGITGNSYLGMYWYRSYCYTGGLVGVNYGLLKVSYATGSVSGKSFGESSSCTAGGLVGYNKGLFNACYATGIVSGASEGLMSTHYVGGLIGYRYSGTITASFWNKQSSGLTDGVGNEDPDPSGVIGKTTAEMKTMATFTASPAFWDFLGESVNGTNDYWRMCENWIDYPQLNWKYIEKGDFACPDGVGLEDVCRLAEDWLVTYTSPTYLPHGADANGDRFVDLSDFAILADHWLEGI